MKRFAPVLIALLVVVAGTLGVAALLAARDEATVSAPPPAPGEPLPPDAPRARVERGLPAGNVVLLHREPGSRPALRALAADLAGPPSRALVEAGQAVLVARAPVAGVEARAGSRRLVVAGPQDPRLRAFVAFWLGRRAE
ncbi:MAG: hypothetical protein M3P39_09015 [Actinomycetota bacterium]|nr:hypothetical protein [Actinomycetota bacterium]